MLREIRKKLVILDNRKPFIEEARVYLEEVEKIDWIYMNLKFTGSNLTKPDVETILQGECILTASVNDHIMIDILDNLRKLIYSCRDMQEDLCLKTLDKIYGVITQGEEQKIPINAEIDSELKKLFRWLSDDMENMDPIKRAAEIHNRLIWIFHFDEYGELVARTAMFYYMVRLGLPICNLNFSYKEYCKITMDYLRIQEDEILYNGLIRFIYNKLEVMLQATNY